MGWSRLSRDSICSRVCWSEEGRRRRRRCVVVVSSFQFPSPFPSIDVYHHPLEFSFLFPYPTCLHPHPIPQPSPHLFPFPSLESPFVRSSASRLAIQYIIPHIPSSPLSSSKNSRTTGTLNYSIFQTIYLNLLLLLLSPLQRPHSLHLSLLRLLLWRHLLSRLNNLHSLDDRRVSLLLHLLEFSVGGKVEL